ncbi:MAG: phosphoribosylaminoimidazolesuccinocarboxamide synthase [Patescibacteria group bacterium]|jgi:phosphoribosylaminoimidazole-succinocarboxamide synthase
MKKVPVNLQDDDLSRYLAKVGLIRISQGKVRDTWSLKNVLGHDNYLLVVATDRISIYDYVLNALIPKKGEVLTALTHFWLNLLTGFENHLILSKLEAGYNFAYDLREDYLFELPVERCLVVKNLTGKMYPAEMIFRAHIGGSVWPEYQKNGIVAGQQLPIGLPKWSKLPEATFTPSTKEEFGNDINKDVDYFYSVMDSLSLKTEAEEVVAMLKEVYGIAYKYAEDRGILILDTKFEVAGKILADEILTPDSSRFALKEDCEEAIAKGRDPYFHDKQPIRDWGATVPTPFSDGKGGLITGLNKLKSESPEYLDYIEFAQKVEVPETVISEASARYLGIVEMITGDTLKYYQAEKMGARLG